MERKPRYYNERLSGERLRACYDAAPPRARRYLDAEIAFVAERAPARGAILELGCGYGRFLRPLSAAGRTLLGIDASMESLRLGRTFLGARGDLWLACMDAAALGFPDGMFDLTLCVQNGISAFRLDPRGLVGEAARVTRPGGTVLFSSYAESFWDGRLEWFRAQAARGLIGEIDETATGRGVIVCKDGLRLGTFGPDDFSRLAPPRAASSEILTVDHSSVFAIWTIT
jgi:2-polyprenyl-6-hydroxyphenyl methylase/3-demethylubiquinone-9 3-methyltransferase